MTRPSLFRFATSELSQDAVLAWLLAWSSSKYADEDPSLHHLGTGLLGLIYGRHGRVLPSGSRDVEVCTQRTRIDVLAVIDGREVVLIEDKVGSSEHSEQLVRYRAIVEKEYPRALILPTYVQTSEQCSFRDVEHAGYRVIRRGDLIGLLSQYAASGGRNDVVVEFLEHLQRIDGSFEAYRSCDLSKWGQRYAWIGFYVALQARLNEGEWSYVPNPSGGFPAFWWGQEASDGITAYLQLEREALCFKIAVSGDSTVRRTGRTRWYNLIKSAAPSSGLVVKKPARFGSGHTMTVAVLDGEYRVAGSEGVLDMEATTRKLDAAREVLQMACVAAASEG